MPKSPRCRLFAAFVLLLLLPPAAASAQPQSYRGLWSFSLEGGADGLNGGTVHPAGTGQVAGVPIRVERRGYPELFDHGWRFGVGLGYGVAEQVEVVVKLSRGGVNGQNEPIGSVDGFSLLAQFDDYRDLALEGGVRYHFARGVPLEPHVTVLGGVRRVGAMRVDLATWNPDPSVERAAFPGVPFFDTSLVPSAGADFGLSYYLGPRTALGFEIGLRYQGRMRGIDTGLAPFGLTALNDAGTRWSIPVLASVRVHF